MIGYNDFVRNSILNFCSFTSMDISLRYIYPKADIQQAATDHDYLEKPFLEYWIDKSLAVNDNETVTTEKTSRGQSSSSIWFLQRKWRITASRFGEIVKITPRRNKEKLCKSLCKNNSFVSLPLLHGKQHEAKALVKLEATKNVKCKRAGLFVRPDFPYLGASPDAIVGNDFTVEVKCPYNGRNELILPGKNFPFLGKDRTGHVILRPDSKYYAQVQGQLFIAKRKFCYFVVYTFVDLFVQVIEFDEDYCQFSLVPKLSLFFEKYFRPYLASLL